jgi:cytochrome c-type biogenesis protein CcsB
MSIFIFNYDDLLVLAIIVFSISVILGGIDLVGLLFWRNSKNKLLKSIQTISFVIGGAILLNLLFYRYLETFRPPFRTLAESLVLFSFTIFAVTTAIRFIHKIQFPITLGGLACAVVLAYSFFNRDAQIQTLPPSLQNFIFWPHVMSYFLAYGSMCCAFFIGVVYLLSSYGKFSKLAWNSPEFNTKLEKIFSAVIKFGFVFLTGGIMLGSIWAQEAWADYWFWDPKENWALISWLVYLSYFHLGYVKDASKHRRTWFAVVGFIVILFTYLGISKLPTAQQSEHVYIEKELKER